MKEMSRMGRPAKHDQIHLRSNAMHLVRQIQDKTGDTLSDIVDAMLFYAYDHMRFEPVEVVTKYRMVFDGEVQK